ncbi:hypothetical protein ABBQ38_004889 [Trebouxia sp. C0009 RCD-2024]
MVETSAQKRKAEDETAALANDTLGQHDQPTSKKIKSEDDDANTAPPAISEPAAIDGGMTGTVNDIHNAAEASVKQQDVSNPETSQDVKAGDVSNHSADMPQAEPDADPPQTLGYKSFQSGDEAFMYFHTLVHDLRNDQDLNEYEHNVVLELVKQGHPEPDAKVGPGVRAIQVREHERMESTCFYLLRTDGTDENFSVRKCICKLFPKWGQKNQRQPSDFISRGGRSSGHGGRSSGPRGGRGGRRGRGRGRGRGRF